MTKMTPRRRSRRLTRLGAGSLALLVVGALAGCAGAADDESATSGTTTATGTSTSPTASSSSGSSSSSSSSMSTSSSSTSSASSPSGRTLTITVDGKKVTPAPRTVDLAVGEKLTLVVTSDHDDELHVHGFEVEGSLTAGRPTTVTLTGKDPGVYEVETHEPPLRLLKIAVR